MTKLLIIADDLTGALDSAVPFAMRGLKTVVARRPEYLQSAYAIRPDVIAVSTASREGSEDAAREAVRRVLEAVDTDRRPQQIFKKIDSRMKGHVDAEVSIVATMRAISRVIVCPAIPSQDRIVEGGSVKGKGVVTPIDVRGCFNLPELDIVTPDASDMDKLGQIVAKARQEDLLVGAAGLAFALAARLAPEPVGNHQTIRLCAPALFAIGSRDLITIGQLAHLKEKSRPAWINAPNGLSCLEDVTDAAVTVVQMASCDEIISGQQAGRNFSATVCQLIPRNFRSLLFCGGETADVVLKSCETGIVELLGELAPGVPAGLAMIGDKKVMLATKSGGFGDVDCLSVIAENVDFMGFNRID